MSQDGLRDFDKLIRNKFSDHELVPKDDLWERLEQRRSSEKKSDRKKLVLLVLLFSFMGLGGLYYTLSPDNELSSDQLNKDSIEKQDVIQQENDIEKSSGETQDAVSLNAELDLQSENEQNISLNTQQRDDSGQNIAVVTNRSSASSGNNVIRRDEIETSSKQGSVIGLSAREKSEGLNDLLQDENIQLDKSAISEEHQLTGQRKLAFDALETISVTEGVLGPDRKQINCPVFKIDQKTNSITVEFGLGPALSFHNLSSNTDDSEYLQVRSETEEALVHYGMSARVKKEWSNNLTLGVGINATVFNYRYRFVNSMETRTTVITIDTLYTPQGQHITVDTLNRIEYGIYEKKSFNKHRLISFPVSLGYSFKMDDYFIEPYGGVTLNWRQFTSGDISSIDDLRPRSIDSESRDALVYKNNLGILYHVGLTVGKSVNERLSIFFQPEFHKVLEPISKENYPVTEERDWVNFNLGVKYKIWQRKHVAR